jgi:hypothetical protein
MKYAAVYWRHRSRRFRLFDRLHDAIDAMERGSGEDSLNPESYWWTTDDGWGPVPEDVLQAVTEELDREARERVAQWQQAMVGQRRGAVTIEGPDGLTEVETGTLHECMALHRTLSDAGVTSHLVEYDLDGER